MAPAPDLRDVLTVLERLLPQHKTDSMRGQIEAAIARLRAHGVAPAEAPSQREVMELALSALHTAVAGLEWYRDRCPDAVDGSDGEADDEIGAAIAALDGALAPWRGGGYR